ncbi:MTRF1L release factor glutamine methyltransferase isoform X2 [Podarcis muralis]
MKVLTSSLYRKLLSLFPHFGKSPAKGSNLNPCHRLLRKYFCYKAGVVTAADLVNYWQGVFEVNEIPEAQASSEYIVSHVLGAKTFQSLNASSISTPLSAKQQERIQQLCAKRLQRMPVQYVLGEWDFQDLTLKMKPPVFIPRPETEELVSLIVDEECRKRSTSANCKHAQLSPENNGLVILEVGCGSGAIALSLLKKLPHSRVIATDKSQAAVNLARENAARLSVQFGGTRIEFLALGSQDRLEILLVYHHCPGVSLPELTELVLEAVLGTPKTAGFGRLQHSCLGNWLRTSLLP